MIKLVNDCTELELGKYIEEYKLLTEKEEKDLLEGIVDLLKDKIDIL
jgi:hypothetical protein